MLNQAQRLLNNNTSTIIINYYYTGNTTFSAYDVEPFFGPQMQKMGLVFVHQIYFSWYEVWYNVWEQVTDAGGKIQY